MLRTPVRFGAPFGTQPVRVSQPATWSYAARLGTQCRGPSCRRLGQPHLRCQALDGWGGQPSPVRAPGNDVMPFDIPAREEPADQAAPPDSPPEASGAPKLTQTSHQDSAAWEAWLKVFAQMDRHAEQQEFLKAALKDAVRCEDYSRAASVKKELAAVQATDAVAAVQQELQAALQEERYSDAAQLRDQGMAWLQGWWAGQAEKDPVGHLLHVAPEFGRYTGRVYTARDLADLSGLHEGGGGLQPLRAMLQPSGRDDSLAGSPAMEVFLVKDAQGSLVHQVVSLLGGPPDAPAAAARKLSSSSSSQGALAWERRARGVRGGSQVVEEASTPDEDVGSVASILGLGPVMRLTVSIARDGSTTIRVTPVPGTSKEAASEGESAAPADGAKLPPTPMSKFSDWEAEEAAATLRALADVAPSPSPAASEPATGASDAASSAVGGPDAAAQQQQQQQQQGPDEEEEDEVTATMRALASEPAPKPGEGSGQGSADMAPTLRPPSMLRPYNPMEDETMIELTHQEYEALFGRDELSEQMKAAEAAEEAADAVRAASQAGADRAGDMVVDVPAARAVDLDATVSADDHDSDSDDAATPTSLAAAADDDEQFAELHRSPARLQQQSVDSFVLRLLRDGYKEAAGSAGDAAQPAVKFEVLMPVGQMAAKGRAEAAITLIAERVAKVQAEQVGRSIPVDVAALQAGLQALLGSLSAGKSAEVLIPSASTLYDADSSPRSRKDDDAAAADDSPYREVKYQRLAPAVVSGRSTDPFTGLYIGMFGTHGPEVMQLQRVVQEGEEWVQAVKVTGDPNVPTGTVSFKAKIGRKHKLSTAHVYPEELGVVGRYKGQGRVAANGYSKPKWVEGELLVFSTSSGLSTGAQLGFVWHVPGERKFLILLQRLDLGACLTAAK